MSHKILAALLTVLVVGFVICLVVFPLAVAFLGLIGVVVGVWLIYSIILVMLEDDGGYYE